MKLFCTLDDLINAFDEDEIRRLSNRNKNLPDINTTVVDKAIYSASAEMAMYLNGRNVLDGDTVPASLVWIACDISRYYLNQNPREETPVGRQYFKCLGQLKDIAKGLLNPGVDDAGEKIEPETTLQFNSGTSMFHNPRNRGGLW